MPEWFLWASLAVTDVVVIAASVYCVMNMRRMARDTDERIRVWEKQANEKLDVQVKSALERRLK